MPEFVMTVKVEYTVQEAQDRGDADGQALNYFLEQFGIGDVEVLEIHEVAEGDEDPA